MPFLLLELELNIQQLYTPPHKQFYLLLLYNYSFFSYIILHYYSKVKRSTEIIYVYISE